MDTLAPAEQRQAHNKGQLTRAAILDAALGLASHMGLEGLSIGALAELTQMSKSGVFAHFGSREELQISVVREYHARFEAEVFTPALAEPRGLPRLRALFERWVRRVSVELDSGCIYISGAVEFDDRPGPVREALVAMVEIHGLILALHYEDRFLKVPGAAERARQGFARILERYRTPDQAPQRKR